MKIKLAKIVTDENGNNLIDNIQYVGANNVLTDDEGSAYDFPSIEEAKEVAIKLSSDNDLFYNIYEV